MKLSFPSVKRIFQFRLRTFLVIVLAAGLFCGWVANEKIQRDRELAAIDQFLTASATTPYEVIRQTVSHQNANGGIPTPGLILL
jgi:ABC-type iron transport system FetAB permease component